MATFEDITQSLNSVSTSDYQNNFEGIHEMNCNSTNLCDSLSSESISSPKRRRSQLTTSVEPHPTRNNSAFPFFSTPSQYEESDSSIPNDLVTSLDSTYERFLAINIQTLL